MTPVRFINKYIHYSPSACVWLPIVFPGDSLSSGLLAHRLFFSPRWPFFFFKRENPHILIVGDGESPAAPDELAHAQITTHKKRAITKANKYKRARRFKCEKKGGERWTTYKEMVLFLWYSIYLFGFVWNVERRVTFICLFVNKKKSEWWGCLLDLCLDWQSLVLAS